MARSFEEMRSDTWSFFDWWNLAGLAALIGLIVIQLTDYTWPLQTDIGTQDGILILTGAYAFTAFNQMRESRWSRKQGEGMALRPHFVDESELGLYNFGEGAALDIRLQIILRGGEDIQELDMVSEEDSVHLPENDYFTIPLDRFKGLNDPESDLHEDPNAILEFYYTWESTTGRQYPSGMEEPNEVSMNEFADTYDSPRKVRVSEIRERLN